MSMMPKTLTEAIRYYSDAQTCINAVAALNPLRLVPSSWQSSMASGQQA
jgi:hypothetical protein